MKERRYDVDCISTHTTHWGHAQTPHPIWVGYSSEIWGTGHSLIPRSGVPNLLGSFARNPNKFGTPILASPKLLTCTLWVGMFALVYGKGYNSTLWGSSSSSQAF